MDWIQTTRLRDRASAYSTQTHMQSYAGGTGWSTLGEISENRAEKEIQSFLSDGAALPRETEMRARKLCPQHQTACSTMYQEKPIRYTKPSNASSQLEQSGFTFTTYVCINRVPLKILDP